MNMAEPLPTIAVAGGTLLAAAFAGSNAPELVQLLIGGLGGAFMARLVPEVAKDLPPVTFVRSIVIFITSVIMAVMIGGFIIEIAAAKGWFANTFAARLFWPLVVGGCAQGIAEFVQTAPSLAKANLIEIAKAFFARWSGRGVQ
jgi:hypothetical protein